MPQEAPVEILRWNHLAPKLPRKSCAMSACDAEARHVSRYQAMPNACNSNSRCSLAHDVTARDTKSGKPNFQDHFSPPTLKSADFTFGTWVRKKSPYQGNLILLTKGVKVLEIAVGAIFPPTRFFLVRISIRDLVAGRENPHQGILGFGVGVKFSSSKFSEQDLHGHLELSERHFNSQESSFLLGGGGWGLFRAPPLKGRYQQETCPLAQN